MRVKLHVLVIMDESETERSEHVYLSGASNASMGLKSE